jgi:hypothetical protein
VSLQIPTGSKKEKLEKYCQCRVTKERFRAGAGRIMELFESSRGVVMEKRHALDRTRRA